MLEKFLKPYNNEIHVGVDEAGRGCLLGPVFAGAVIWDNNIEHYNLKYIKDSKKLSKKKRNEMRKFIEDNALAYSVASCDNTIIDDINILEATYKAMHKALDKVYENDIKFNRILADGNRFKPYLNNNNKIEHNCIINGDNRYIPIAAASILAKTHRDEYMINLSKKHPEYDFDKHKGYGTKKHLQAIHKLGYLDCHRKTFQLKNSKSGSR